MRGRDVRMEQDRSQTEYSRKLRREMTPTEKRLWYQLRGRRFTGWKFRRQTPLAGYIADFYCAQALLVIELDGESHLGKEKADENRQRILESMGFKVLRFWDTDVYESIDAVLETIWRECKVRVPHPSPPTPLPQGERGERHPSPPTPLPQGERGERKDAARLTLRRASR
jgi:very-short-patch-repair endonuclease